MPSLQVVLVGENIWPANLSFGETSPFFQPYDFPSRPLFYESHFNVDGKRFEVKMFDYAENFMRPEYHPNTDMLIIAFNLQKHDSYEKIVQLNPSKQGIYHNVPTVLVGFKRSPMSSFDAYVPVCRSDANKTDESEIKTTEIGKELARKINAVKYFDCSTVNYYSNYEEILCKEAIEAWILHGGLTNRKTFRAFKILVVRGNFSNSTSSTNELVKHFLFDDRVNVLDQYLNDQPYAMERNENLISTFIEIDGEELDLEIQMQDTVNFFDMCVLETRALSRRYSNGVLSKKFDAIVFEYSVTEPDSFEALTTLLELPDLSISEYEKPYTQARSQDLEKGGAILKE